MKKRTKSKLHAPAAETVSVSFEFTSASARQVCLAGSFNDWRPDASPMLAMGDGRWVKCLTLPPGRYEYRFVVDGQWVDDPKAVEFVANLHGTLIDFRINYGYDVSHPKSGRV